MIFWTKPYELGSINTQLTMLLSVLFIAIFGKSYIVYVLLLPIPTHCRRKVDTLLLPGNHRKHNYCESSWDDCEYVHSKYCVQKYAKIKHEFKYSSF